MGGGTNMKRNYATGNITANNSGDYDMGGFAGYLGESNGLPYTVSDNFSTGIMIDTAGLYGTWPDYVGGFVGFIPARKNGINNIIENNYYANSEKGCSGATPTSEQPTCTKVDESALQDISHPVYTRAGNAWDFTGTWWAQNNALPLLKPNITVGS